MRQTSLSNFKKSFANSWQLQLIILLPLIYLFVFKYYPMLGAQIAFKNYIITRGIWGSPWVGLKHFIRFFQSHNFTRVMGNTLILSVYGLVIGFPFPILLAVSLNSLYNQKLKKTVQMISYAPHFISMVVMVGIIFQFFGPRTGFINRILLLLGKEEVNFLGNAGLFPHLYVWTNVWQQVGYGSIIYIAVLSSADPELHEASIIDGATRFQRVRHIDFPVLLPTAIVMLIMNTGRILEIGFEKALLMQNDLNLRTAEVIDTYVYKVGLTSAIPNYSYATAIGLFKSVIGLILLIVVNKLARKYSETSLW